MTVASMPSANKTTSHEIGRLTKPSTTTNFERIDTEWANPYLQRVVLQRRLSVRPQQYQQQQQQQKPRRSRWRRARNALHVR